MIDVSPTAAVSTAASVPLAALGRDTFEPGTGMHDVAAGPALAIDVGARIGHHVLPHVTFERGWHSCGDGCGAVNDAVVLSLRVTSGGRLRAFGDVGFGFRRLITDPTGRRVNELLRYASSGWTENRTNADGASSDITWTGIDALRLGIGGAYDLDPRLAFELSLGCALGSFRHVKTSQGLNTSLEPNPPRGFEADLREETRKGYVILGLAVSVRGFLL